MLLAGAWAVQVGTATLIDPSAPVEVARGVSNVPQGEALRVAGRLRGRLRIPAVLRRGSRDDMIPRPENPLVVALDVSDAERGRRARLEPRLARRLAEGRAGAVLGGRPGDRAAHRVSCTGLRRREAARHPEHGRAGVREHRQARCADVQRARARRRGDDARGPQRRRPRRRRGGRPAPLVLAVTVLSSQSGEGLASPASLAFEAKASGLDGVVVSGEDVRDVRDVVRRRLLSGRSRHPSRWEQRSRSGARADPCAAIESGADYIVVGRPITECRRSRPASPARSSAKRADPRGRRTVASGTRRPRSMFALCRARGGAYTRRVPARRARVHDPRQQRSA